MFNVAFCSLCKIAVVEISIKENALRPVFKITVSEDCIGTVVIMPPYKRNFGSVLMSKGVTTNGTAVTAPEIVPSSPAAKVIAGMFRHDVCDLLSSHMIYFHFDFILCRRIHLPHTRPLPEAPHLSGTLLVLQKIQQCLPVPFHLLHKRPSYQLACSDS